MQHLQDKADGAVTYVIGGGAISFPVIQHLLEIGTSFLGFLTALGGLILVVWRLQYEHKKRYKK